VCVRAFVFVSIRAVGREMEAEMDGQDVKC